MSIAEVSFATSKAEFAAISKIVDRVMGIRPLRETYASRLDIHMDIAAVHANGNPLRLDDLLAADEFNFIHDIAGISRHLDRDTGKLGDGFTPRYSRR